MIVDPYRFGSIAPAVNLIALSDAFTGTTIDAAKWTPGVWWRGTASVATVAQNNRLEITPGATSGGPGVNQSNGIVSASTFAFSGKDAFVRIGPVTADGNDGEIGGEFAIYTDANNGFYFYTYGLTNKTRARKIEGGVISSIGSAASVAFNQNLWLRIRENGGVWYFYTAPHASADAPTQAQWAAIGSSATFAGQNTAAVRVGLAGGGTLGTTNKVYFDGFNIATA